MPVRRPDEERVAELIATITGGAAPAALHPVSAFDDVESGSLVRTILTNLDDAKAEDVISIDLHGKTTLADVMIVASGRSTVHVGAIADRVIKALKQSGKTMPRVEGLPGCDWVLVDAGDVIVHVFKPEVRQFYNLEKMWGGDRPGERRSA